MWGSESKFFALFPEYITRFKALQIGNKAYLETAYNGTFEAVFFCPASLQKAALHIRNFCAIDRTYTRSK
jgi:hypothetical protein